MFRLNPDPEPQLWFEGYVHETGTVKVSFLCGRPPLATTPDSPEMITDEVYCKDISSRNSSVWKSSNIPVIIVVRQSTINKLEI